MSPAARSTRARRAAARSPSLRACSQLERRAIFARRNAKSLFVAAAEMAEIGEPARERDLRDAVACVQRVCQVPPAPFQPPLPDLIADRALLCVEQILKIARGNTDKAGNLFGIECVVVQEAVDQRLRAEDQSGPRRRAAIRLASLMLGQRRSHQRQ